MGSTEDRSRHGICEHNRIRRLCRDCGGESMCAHSRVRSKCKNCQERLGGGVLRRHLTPSPRVPLITQLLYCVVNIYAEMRVATTEAKMRVATTDFGSLHFGLFRANPQHA